MKYLLLFLYFPYLLKGFHSKDYVETLKMVTDVMVEDVTSPVAAARYYAYINLAAVETASYFTQDPKFQLAKKLGFKPTFSAHTLNLNGNLAIQFSILKGGHYFLPSGYLFPAKIEAKKIEFLKFGFSEEEIDAALAFSNGIVQDIFQWAKKDGFTQLNNLVRYTPKEGQGYWKPTPPVFMAPVEPHWNTIKPLVLSSADQFLIELPAPFDLNENSSFYTQMLEVYETVKTNSNEKKEIALFWDCNPFEVQQIGHIEFGLKKISPGGHWIGITGIACIKSDLNIMESTLVHALVSVICHDAFIACWHEKYVSERIRPETIINEILDPTWRPVLQTPPFPEYVSGHSVVSTAAAQILTHIFGDHYDFIDDTEVEFGLPIRSFPSFKFAAHEASISRLYGGIHFKDAIDQGIFLGQQVSDYGITQLKDYFPDFQ
jgi:hypothetical protein